MKICETAVSIVLFSSHKVSPESKDLNYYTPFRFILIEFRGLRTN